MAQHDSSSVPGSKGGRGGETLRRGLTALLLVGAVACEDCNPIDGPDAGEPDPGWVLVQPFPEIQTLHDVHVLSDVRAYAVGTEGAVLRYDEGQWAQEDAGTEVELRSVSGVALTPDDEFVMAVGAAGTVIVREAGSWRQLPAPTTGVLFGVWVVAEDDAFIVGDDGAIFRWDGTDLIDMATTSRQVVQLTYPEITAASDAGPANYPDAGIDLPPDAFLCDPAGPVSPLMYCTYSSLTAPLKGVAGAGPNNVFAVGPQGSVYRFDGMAWAFDETGTTRSLAGVFVGDGVFVVGADGMVARRNGRDNWNLRDYKMDLPIYVQSIYSAGGDDLFAVGLAGSVYNYIGNGEYQKTDIEPNIEWRGVHGVGRVVFAVGAGGRILRGPAQLRNEFEEGDAGVLIPDGRTLRP